MKTGTHNPNFQEDYLRSTWSQEKEDAYMLGINKKAFFSMLKSYQPLDRYDEPRKELLEVSDDEGHDIQILFKPTFNVMYSENFMTGVPTYDKEETDIELLEVDYVYFHSEDKLLEYEDFTDIELEEIQDLLKVMCK